MDSESFCILPKKRKKCVKIMAGNTWHKIGNDYLPWRHWGWIVSLLKYQISNDWKYSIKFRICPEIKFESLSMHKNTSSILCAQWTLNIVSQKCHQTSAKICLNHEEIEKIKEGISGPSAIKGKQIGIFPDIILNSTQNYHIHY